ncbi:MAG: SDR family oxidoreductase [Bacteroidaceae bacterium]|nr:SDR family oxidoreductase [Bacteroidaceae bacterium]
MKQKEILVAGGAGFVGSHLCRRLLDDGHKVICIDNLHTGQLNNIESLLKYPGYTFIKHDIIYPFKYDGHLNEIYNLACPASPKDYQAQPIQTIKTSVIGTMNLLNLAENNHCTFLQASTSEVYGDAEIHPQSENYWGNVNPIGIRACYDEGKRCAESLCMDYHRQFGTKVKIIRIFNTYGPNMRVDDGRVISNFIVQALRGDDITIYGDGRQTRSFQYIDDLLSGISKMMQTSDDFTGPVNIGNPDEYSILELAEMILQLTNSPSKLETHPMPIDDPKCRRPDISLATTMLNGWKPKIGLEEGLKGTIEYFKEIHKPISA